MSTAVPSGRTRLPTVPLPADPRQDDDASPADVQEAARRLLMLVSRLPKDAANDGVVLDLVLDGARCVVTRSARSALDGNAHPAHLPPGTALTPREQEIARMVGDGFTNKEIASVLEISSWTVSTHLRRIFGKLDVGTRAAMVARLAHRSGADLA